MFGRGRGGGRGRGLTFPVEQIGFGKGDTLPPPIAQPPVLFPPLEFKPTPLVSNEEQAYLLNLKQELRGTLCDSGFYVKPVLIKKDIDRYSDKYQQSSTNNNIKWDWSRFPKELKPVKGRKRLSPMKSASKGKLSESDIKNKLEQLESAEKTSTSDEEEDEENDGEEIERDDDEYYDEEEEEEGTDYVADYFDNGEDYLDEDENLDDGPIY